MTGLLNYDQWLAALCLWREARGCSAVELDAIWHVILNRVKDPEKRWPRYITHCILEPFQFSSFNAVPHPELGDHIYKCDVNAIKFPLWGTEEWPAFQLCMDVVGSSIGDDPTHGANHYESVAQGRLPGWADPVKITATIGPFRFYKL